MNEHTLNNCRQLIENRDRIKSVFAWDGGLMQLCCAGIYTSKALAVDENILQTCKELINEKVGMFSNFRSTARAPIASMIATGGNPEQTLEKGLQVYALLKNEFRTSTYLPIAAMTIAQRAKPYQYEQIARRTKVIYDRLKADHPFLTSSEDSAFCALMALSEKSDEQLITEAEECYQRLKPNFFSSNAVQSLSHVLALCDGKASEKCSQTMDLFNKLENLGRRYGTDYELPTLGVLAMSGGNLDDIVNDMLEIDGWLAEQKGFGLFGSISKKQRLMYAGILAQRDYINEDTMQAATVGSTIALIVAQEAAMCAAIAASSAAAASTT